MVYLVFNLKFVEKVSLRLVAHVVYVERVRRVILRVLVSLQK
jgi:hypothetical protein